MKYCAQCGAQLVDEAVVCPHCGCAVAPTKTVDPNASPKSRLITLLLCIFVGGLGIHRFYVGKIGTGVLWLAGRPDHDRLRHIHRQRRKAGHRLADLNAAQKIAPRPDGRGAFCTFYGSISMI